MDIRSTSDTVAFPRRYSALIQPGMEIRCKAVIAGKLGGEMGLENNKHIVVHSIVVCNIQRVTAVDAVRDHGDSIVAFQYTCFYVRDKILSSAKVVDEYANSAVVRLDFC